MVNNYCSENIMESKSKFDRVVFRFFIVVSTADNRAVTIDVKEMWVTVI